MRKTSEELQQKLERIEALYRRPGTPGEKQAAAIAMNRLRVRLHAVDVYRKQVTVREYTFPVFKI